MAEIKRSWTTTELAKVAGLSRAYIRQLILAGRIRAEKVGRDWIISDNEVLRFLEQRRQSGR
jgi:excisionase family DNA binding protein